jgi:hypothetical protein
MAQLKYWNGSAWVAAAVGAQGESGAAGVAGPSVMTDISIPSWTLNTPDPGGYATSSSFGLLLAGKSYQILTQLRGTGAGNAAISSLGFELLSSTGDNPSYFYNISPEIRYASGSTNVLTYGINSIAAITVGASNISLSAKVIDGYADTGNNNTPLVFTGKSLITLVGTLN